MEFKCHCEEPACRQAGVAVARRSRSKLGDWAEKVRDSSLRSEQAPQSPREMRLLRPIGLAMTANLDSYVNY